MSIFESLVQVEGKVKEVLDILGLLPPGTYLELKDKALKRAGLVEDDVLRLIEERTIARKNKDFSKSDQIRAYLTTNGIALMDLGKETIWRPCIPVEPEQGTPPVEKEDQKLAATEEEPKS